MATAVKAPLKLGVLGAGGFVRDAYLGPLRANADKILVSGVYSRSQESVEAILPAIQGFSPSCRPYHGDAGLQELLASPEVDAVLVALPPQAQSAVIQAALRAGKHILSEKPAAPTLEQAQQLLTFYRGLPQPAPLWCVAENYRSMDAFLRLRDSISSGQLGAIACLDMAVDLAMSPGNKYYESAWRRDSAGMPGAYLTEGGVHFIAALRMAARAAGFGEVTVAAAASRGVAPDLPHPDTLLGTLWFESGAAASYTMTMAAGQMRIALRAVGTAGTAEAARGGFGGGGRAFRLVQQIAGDTGPTQVDCTASGVEAELLCFARLARAAGTSGSAGASLTLTPREAATAARTDGSDPEPEAAAAAAAGGAEAVAPAAAAPSSGGAPVVVAREAGGEAPLEDMPSAEDAYRISCVEAVLDLAVATALLVSADCGGQPTKVAQC